DGSKRERRPRARAAFVEAALAALLLCQGDLSASEPTFPGKTWENADPARIGWSASRLDAARRYALEIGSTAVLIVQDGRVVASWGNVAKKVEIHSVRKSFMDALYGIALARHRIDLGKTLSQLAIDDKPPSLTTREKQATVRDLLMARSGVYHKAAYETK